MNRRNFLALGVISVLPFPCKLLGEPTKPSTDEYATFLERVRYKVVTIVRREGRGLRKMYIDPPRADGAWYVRTVHVFLEPGPSLMDKLHFQFDEVSGSRWDGD